MRLVLCLALAAAVAEGPVASGQDAQEPSAEAKKVQDNGRKDPIPLPPPPPPKIDPSGNLLPRSSATTTVISGEHAESLGVRFVVDVLRIAPGLEVQRMSSTESSVSLRSYNDDSSSSQGVMGLYDGRQVYNEFFGAVLWDNLPVTLDDTRQVEIIRGPGSFLYGPNAMHGLVNIISKSPLDYPKDHQVFMHAAYGSYRSDLETFTYVRRDGDAALKVKVGHEDISGFDYPHGNTKDKGFIEARFETLLGGDLDHRLDFSGGASQQRFNILIPTFSGLPNVVFSSEADEPFARATYALGDFKVKSSWTEFDAVTVPDRVYTGFDIVVDVVDLDIQYTGRIGAHVATAGIGERYATYETSDADVSRGRHRTRLGWLYFQDEWKITPEIDLTGGLRIDDHSVVGTHLSPRLALVWQVDRGSAKPGGEPRPEEPYTGQVLRATAGYGYRNPSLRELWFDMPVFGGFGTIAGNRDLDPEFMRSFEVGYWGRPIDFVQIECSVYYNRIDDLVEYRQPNPPVPVFAPTNVGEEEAYGVETRVEANVADPLFAFATHAFEIRRDRETHDRNPAAPRHKAGAGLRYEDKPWGAMLWATFFDDIEFIDTATGASLGKLDEYALLNARVWRTFKLPGVDGRIFLQAFNLLDHDHREHAQGESYGLLFMGGLDLAW